MREVPHLRDRLRPDALAALMRTGEDSGGIAGGAAATLVVAAVCFCWSLFQLWYASPLPYMIGPVVLNSTQARSIHLGFALLLAFLLFPTLKNRPGGMSGALDWLLALAGSFCAAYLFLFYDEITARPATPTWYDIAIGTTGLVLLLEATRRAIGLPLVIVALVFLSYVFFGNSDVLPDVIRWKGATLERAINHQWSTEGVFGVPLGVSTSFVFLFVLFGALLDRAGAGNFFIKVAYALLGHMRGGPAKTSVLASGMMALISGSSIANTVTTGTFTIPLMKRAGLPAHKAGAVEVAASVDGQIMPPVMGAAAFLIMEYVGISYVEVIKHAILPAVMSYAGLLYIVHLEAVKAGMKGQERSAQGPLTTRLLRAGIILCSLVIVAGAAYYLVTGAERFLGPLAPWVVGTGVAVGYVALTWVAARQPDLEEAGTEQGEIPKVGETLKAGLHFLLPVVVLIWMLLVERLSPSLSAFWAVVLLIGILLTQRPLIALFRRAGDMAGSVGRGIGDLIEGLIAAPRNMVGVAVATAAAGIVVGTVTLTGIGQVMTAFVEALSGGNVVLMLLLTAVLCLILGMGLPTTANYIVVSSLMAPVIVQLGTEAGLAVELIAVHMFVFYFGLMADVTPPVGLAAFAASGISGADPIRTGVQAFFYSLRTAILPFIFVFNTELLLIDVGGPLGLALVVMAGFGAMLLFAAAMQGHFMARCRLWEIAALLLVAFTLLRPGYWMDMIAPPHVNREPQRIVELAGELPAGESLRLVVSGTSFAGEAVTKTVLLPLGPKADGTERLREAGLVLNVTDEAVRVLQVPFGTPAKRFGVLPGWTIETVRVPSDRPPKEVMFLPALALLALVMLAQRRRGGTLAGGA
jgi:TRAP transporter 4TM/12TM fusion protein